MDRKQVRNLRRAFEKRGGMFGANPDLPPEMMTAFLEELLECPECRAAVLEACNGEDRKDVDIDALIRDLVLSRDH